MDSKKKIYLSSPHMGGNELTYIHEAFETNWISPVGPHLAKFEEQLQNYTGMKHAAALSSGTAAIHLALKILDVKPGDFVICQSFTFAGTVNPVAYCGATPIFIDSELDTWNMDPEVLENAIKEIGNREQESGKIKAIIPVHLYGMPAKIDELKSVAGKYNIPLIEDAAEALGAYHKNKPCGSFGDFGILSFNGNKIITTSSGGALLSNTKEWVDKAKFLATQARDNAPHYQHTEIGYNYRLSNISAGIGMGQMEVLDKHVELRRGIFERYYEAFGDRFTYQGTGRLENGIFSNRWLTCILTESFEQREKIRLALELENIECRPLWKPMHLQPVFQDLPYFGGKVAEELFEKGLCLPSGSNMNEEEVNRVINGIKRVFH